MLERMLKNLWTMFLDKNNLISTRVSFPVSHITFLILSVVISAFGFNT